MARPKKGAVNLSANAFGKLVTAYREQREWSQEELAEHWGYSREYVSQIERGKRKLTKTEQVNRLADILEIPQERLEAIGKGIPQRQVRTQNVFESDDALFQAILQPALATVKLSWLLYVVVSAAAPAESIQDFVRLAQGTQWKVCILSTPHARRFLDVLLLEQLTGYPVRSEYRQAQTTPISVPPADALVVAPATFNTTNKIALGIADNLATSVIGESIGRNLPVLVVPCANRDHFGRHPAFLKSLEILRSWGVHVLFDLEKYPPRNEVPWQIVLHMLHCIRTKGESE